MTTTDTENDLLDAASEIGRLVDMPSWFAGLIAVRIEHEHSGKRMNDLTIGELTALIRDEGGKLDVVTREFLAEFMGEATV